jgi:hypothetical protein
MIKIVAIFNRLNVVVYSFTITRTRKILKFHFMHLLVILVLEKQ